MVNLNNAVHSTTLICFNILNYMNYCKVFEKKPVAYFCAEYALFDHTPLYAGGLGILSGDYVQEMIDQKLPSVAIGLFYHKEHQHGLELDNERKTPEELGLSLVRNKDGSVLKIPINFPKNIVEIQAWTWKKGELNLYLLDTQIEENSLEDRMICDTLYVEDRYLRLQQEIILGTGGVKLLNALKITPSVYHMNEGHSAFLSFELIKDYIEKHTASFATACKEVREQIVFTNHTLVSAGQEVFDMNTIKSIFSDELADLGFDEKTKMFSMTRLALTMSSKVNAVSKLHGKLAAELWEKYDTESITNGIYLPRWDTLKYYSHKESKKKLLKYIQNKCGVNFDENTLLLGWARRFVEYKRPLAIVGNVERLKKIASVEGKKIVIVFSSTINPSYTEENSFYKELTGLIKNELEGIVTFIPNYDIEISKLMTAGCDVWLNTPIVGYEACGTSGMKACLNGTLPLSTNDGWIHEVDISSAGWIVEDKSITNNLLDLLEQKVIPEYYSKQENWNERIKNSRTLILDQFSTERMLHDYVEKMYLPISSKIYP